MNIFYVSNTCSSKKFKQLFNESKVKPQQQAQKFHNLFIKGLGKQNNQLFIMSATPINRKINSKIWVPKEKERDESILYYYLPFVNFPIVKQFFIFIFGFFTCIYWGMINKGKQKLVVCDVLNVTNSVSALLASKLLGLKSVAIVTDLPSYMSQYGMNKNKGAKAFVSFLYRTVCNFFIFKYDSYMILTEHMNEVVNPRNKPFVVIEGMVDCDMLSMINKLENKYHEKIVIYAGALYEKYGVKKLIHAFMKLNMQEARLWLFGSGEMESEIKIFEQKDERIKYFGVIPNQEIVQEEMKATLLVNPRPSMEEFTMFSFPSKNMEYMASGTPMLTTKLPGMPDEYMDYIYIIENECEDGIAESLQNILEKNKEELFLKGHLAKEFVLKEKNNLVQAKKFMEKFL